MYSVYIHLVSIYLEVNKFSSTLNLAILLFLVLLLNLVHAKPVNRISKVSMCWFFSIILLNSVNHYLKVVKIGVVLLKHFTHNCQCMHLLIVSIWESGIAVMFCSESVTSLWYLSLVKIHVGGGWETGNQVGVALLAIFISAASLTLLLCTMFWEIVGRQFLCNAFDALDWYTKM